jgi:hypothetical protein
MVCLTTRADKCPLSSCNQCYGSRFSWAGRHPAHAGISYLLGVKRNKFYCSFRCISPVCTWPILDTLLRSSGHAPQRTHPDRHVALRPRSHPRTARYIGLHPPERPSPWLLSGWSPRFPLTVIMDQSSNAMTRFAGPPVMEWTQRPATTAISLWFLGINSPTLLPVGIRLRWHRSRSGIFPAWSFQKTVLPASSLRPTACSPTLRFRSRSVRSLSVAFRHRPRSEQAVARPSPRQAGSCRCICDRL